MAEDGGKEEKFDFTAEGETLGYISLDQARVLAMRTAREAPGAYGRRFRNAPMAFEAVEEDETEDHYVVTLSFRPQGQFIGTPGQEQFFIEKEGAVAHRQVLGFPVAERGRRFPLVPIAIGLVAVAIAVVVAGVIFVGDRSRGGDGEDNPNAGLAPTSTPAPTSIPPTATVAPVALITTPVPTAMLAPTHTPTPTPARMPTLTPRPRATPIPTATSLPLLSRDQVTQLVSRVISPCKSSLDDAYGAPTMVVYGAEYLGNDLWLVDTLWPTGNMSYGSWNVDSITGQVTPYNASAQTVLTNIALGGCGLPSSVNLIKAEPAATLIPTPTQRLTPIPRPTRTPTPRPVATPTEAASLSSTPSTFFTFGSHKDDVVRLQGAPTSVTLYSALGQEDWFYGSSRVSFELPSNRVIEWSNSAGNLKAGIGQ